MEPTILVMAAAIAMAFFDAGSALVVFSVAAFCHVAFDF
jgi:hypothetical protein